VKIVKYRSGLQHDLRELSRTSPTGAWCANLTDLVQYATIHWSVIHERVSRRKKQFTGKTSKVAGKRKASGGGASGSGRFSSKAKLGASGTPFTEEQKKRDFELKLCHKCPQPSHQMRQCPLNSRRVEEYLQLLVEVLLGRTICPRRISRESRCRRARDQRE
jgi:hypothetical protein